MQQIPNYQLVENMIKAGALKNLTLRGAFLSVDRADFVPELVRQRVYLNEALPIGYGQTISQPTTIAFMLELLDPQPGERVLDVGSGSGYQTALLAYLVNYQDAHHRGKVFGLEIVPELAKQSLRNLAKYEFVRRGVVEIHCLNAERGYPAAAPFDKIVSAARLGRAVPAAWKEQLKLGGRIVTPIGEELVVLTKTKPPDSDDFIFTEQNFPGFVFVPFQEEGGAA